VPLFVGKKLEQADEPPQRAIGMAVRRRDGQFPEIKLAYFLSGHRRDIALD
jgi:hypothetical protein